MSTFQTLSVNRVGKVRWAKLHGRDYLVAPMTMIVPGVLSGSNGPLYYPPDEVSQNVDTWNGVPILLGHPQTGSGRTPDAIERAGVGQVFNARVRNGRLQADAWIDVERMQQLAPDALAAIKRGSPVELSTGLRSSFDDSPGSYDGQLYRAVARNILADHLALLVNGERGACACARGCGINNAGHQQPEPLGLPTWDGRTSAAQPTAVAGRREQVDIHGNPCLGLPDWDDLATPQPATSRYERYVAARAYEAKPAPLGLPSW